VVRFIYKLEYIVSGENKMIIDSDGGWLEGPYWRTLRCAFCGKLLLDLKCSKAPLKLNDVEYNVEYVDKLVIQSCEHYRITVHFGDAPEWHKKVYLHIIPNEDVINTTVQQKLKQYNLI
jgi:hypothetical protein